MSDYDEICVGTFLKSQGRLFDEPVAEDYEEAEAFLEDSLAVVADTIQEVRAYLGRAVWMYPACPMKNCRKKARYLLCLTGVI